MRDHHWSDVTDQTHAEARIEEGGGVWPSMVNLDLGDVTGIFLSDDLRTLAAMLQRVANECDVSTASSRSCGWTGGWPATPSEAKCPNTYCYGGWVGRGDNESGGAPAFPCRHEKCPHCFPEASECFIRSALLKREGGSDDR